MQWFTARRLRAQATCLGLCLFAVYIWTLSTPGLRDRNGLIKGTDFLHFYTLGTLALGHDGADLYDMQAQSRIIRAKIPAAAGTEYLPLYGPQVSLIFAPLASLPYGAALGLWWTVSASLYFGCVWRVWRTCEHLASFRGIVFLIAAANPAFFHLLAWGQTSAPALLCFTLLYLGLRANRPFLGGVALGCLVFKPQLALAAAFVFLAAGEWMVVTGALISAAAQLASGWAYYDAMAYSGYLDQLRRLGSLWSWLEPRPYQTYSLRSFWLMLVASQSWAWWLYATSAMLVLVAAFFCWRSRLPLSLRYSALLLATVLVSPHLTVYDLVILAPAYLLLADWLVGTPEAAAWSRFVVLLYLVFLLPLFTVVTRWTHLQLTVPLMVALLLLLVRRQADDPAAHAHRQG
jgi:hypothetical protein